MRFLITGGSGYFGSVLKLKLLKNNHQCVNIDLLQDIDMHPDLTSQVVDITDPSALDKIFQTSGPFDAVFHCAAQLEYKKKNADLFYKTNRDAAGYLAELGVKHRVKNFIFISSNCVYGKVNSILVKEDQAFNAFERYGQCKLESEQILNRYQDRLNVIIFRPPTIVGEGRLGILSVVYDFIRENRKIWLVGHGDNRYQFIYGDDLAEACLLAATSSHSGTYNIGSDHVPSLNQLFSDVIRHADSESKIYHLPRMLALPIMQAAYRLGISPLGPYNYTMLSSSYIGDTEKIKSELTWQPTKTNSQMLIDGYNHYIKNYAFIHDKNKKLPGHRKAGWGGVLNLVRWIS